MASFRVLSCRVLCTVYNVRCSGSKCVFTVYYTGTVCMDIDVDNTNIFGPFAPVKI